MNTPTPIPAPTAAPVSDVLRIERVHVSHYTPGAGGTNCSNFQNDECISRMASGKNWKNYIDRAAACPIEWPFGLKFRLPDGRIFECLDRGGNIRYGYTPSWMPYDGLAWVDLLTGKPRYKFGEVVRIEFLK